MKEWLIENREWFSGILVVVSAVAVVMLVVFTISVVSKDDITGAAKCRSVQGEYGAGKCFKDEKEI